MKPIRTEEDHRAVLEEIGRLMGAAAGSPEADRLEILAVLVSEYERRTIVEDKAPDPVEVLGIIMRGKGLSQATLSDVIGSRARASEILSRRRSLSSEMIDRLSRSWSISRRLLSGRSAEVGTATRLKNAATALAVGICLVGAGLGAPIFVYGRDLPDVSPLVVEARAGSDYSALPPHVAQAFIAMQDRHFLSHAGYDRSAIVRASGQSLADVRHPVGAATLTQQLLKGSLLRDEPKSVRRKVREVLLARKLEQLLTKDQILQLYLARTYFGGDSFGIEAASRSYFGRNARDLSLAQAAYLAALVNAPNDIRLDREANRPRAIAARDAALNRMVRAGFLTPALRQEAARERFW